MSLHRICVLIARRRFLISLIGMTLSASAQYPGQVGGKSKDTVELRAIGVLEWTGEEGKPKASRLVPVTVYDGTVLQDGNVYLARPHPLALGREVEYELQRDGKPIGFFDIKNAGQEQGSWVGYGTWKPLPQPRSKALHRFRRKGRVLTATAQCCIVRTMREGQTRAREVPPLLRAIQTGRRFTKRLVAMQAAPVLTPRPTQINLRFTQRILVEAPQARGTTRIVRNCTARRNLPPTPQKVPPHPPIQIVPFSNEVNRAAMGPRCCRVSWVYRRRCIRPLRSPMRRTDRITLGVMPGRILPMKRG